MIDIGMWVRFSNSRGPISYNDNYDGLCATVMAEIIPNDEGPGRAFEIQFPSPNGDTIGALENELEEVS